MITNFLLFILTELINSTIGKLDVATFPDWLDTGIDTLSYYIQQWNFIFPMSNFILFITFIFLVETAILTIFAVNYIIKIARGSG